MLHSFSGTNREESDKVNKNYDTEVLAKKWIHDHRNPIVKFCLPSHKLFYIAKNEEEKALIKEHQNKFVSILEHQRVEKRSNRAQAIWLADKGVAKVTKIVKNLIKYFGYQNKEGVFLYPEEMLYLIETNRLEVTFVDTSLSIEKTYELVLKTPDVNLTKYRVYKKLAILGYKLIRFEQIPSKTSHRIKKIKIKRSLEEVDSCEFPELKKLKQYPTEVKENESEPNSSSDMLTNKLQAETSMPKEAQYILNIFDQLRGNMPRDCANKIKSTNPDYCVWSPTNILKAEPDYNLFICEKNIIDMKNFNSNLSNIYAICVDDVSFYRFSDVHLPYI